MAPRRRRGRALVLAGVLLALAALTTRMLLGARAELARARAAAAASRPEPRREIRHLRRALAYYLPGNPWVRAAHDRLLELSRAARARGAGRLALHACRELRSAILALRGLTRPYSASLPELNRCIAELAPREPGAAPALRTPDGQQRLRHRLRHPPEPHPGWAALGLLGFGVWVGGALALLYRGLRPDARLVGRRFWPLAALSAGGLGLFYLGMGLA